MGRHWISTPPPDLSLLTPQAAVQQLLLITTLVVSHSWAVFASCSSLFPPTRSSRFKLLVSTSQEIITLNSPPELQLEQLHLTVQLTASLSPTSLSRVTTPTVSTTVTLLVRAVQPPPTDALICSPV